ncbi:unnamed protein product [Bursaphelenchus xylophilus]|uniref:(pine wood nematode) hypothetical protein n=1 Tax=Bursaphelenchus xylophilus TaxID=6326 RepID=A0A1I7RLS4_BURXY|nr:unnamed protein product [Bursaphelenchus xylophilus]CAG9106309.1 unnamed protein product [Bursaphelenchus xylophilus]
MIYIQNLGQKSIMLDSKGRSCSSASIEFAASHRDSILPAHLEEDEYYRCCCGMHVHMGTFIISLLFCLQWIASLIPFLSTSRWEYLTMTLPVITALPPILLLIGNRKNFPALYWPHIILHGTIFAIMFLTAIGVVCLGFYMMMWGLPSQFRRNRQLYRFMKQLSGTTVTVAGALLLCFAYICYYLLHVVYRGYRFLVEALYYD